ncbi:O-acetylhomoserine aminocarboxypropyltransferase/cysteine synthase family protein [Treponema endosymbiont of Eucomonympha sp.]|uniref:O-acetylhomoserine aminocarboxypropyltransferase/cysteine synthase family protein n=1 Tax=Treponema endosymbiont of Eucomonympha sp. TaxID=1580831 RepID=UPI000750B88F|nr:aminotransferase class I/II-fold pyridoxal phosphate-dependent enzyme [Treponema endosymbiont of Eucomonympha sp.]
MADAEYHFDTLKIRAAYDPGEHNQAVFPPIYQTAAYEFRDTAHASKLFTFSEQGFLYTRVTNPTVDVLEKRIATLDGGTVGLAVASGMAAITYTLLTLAENSGRILTSTYLYGGSTDAFQKLFLQFGVAFDQSPHIDDAKALERDIKPDNKAIFVETVSNPTGAVVDLEALSALAHKHGIPLVVDNTFAAPYLLNPIKYGADIVVYSATKALNGHGNLITGVIVESGKFPWDNDNFPQMEENIYALRDRATGQECSPLEVFPNAAFVTRIRLRYLNYFSAVLSPFDAYLALVGIETLSERVAKQVSNTQKVIAYLEHSPHVAWVKHPSVKSSPYYRLGQKYLPKGAPGILSFGFKGTVEQSEAFLAALKLWSYHGNVGDARSLIVNSPESTHSELMPEEQKLADIEPNLLRISLRLEGADDLIADLDREFVKVFRAKGAGHAA